MTKEEMLKKLIKEKYGTQKEFCDKTGIPPSTLSNMLSKGVLGSSIEIVMKVCKALGITVEQLCNNTNDSDEYIPEVIAAHFDGEKYSQDDIDDIKKAIEIVKSIKKRERDT